MVELVDRPHGWTLQDAISELQVEVFRQAFASAAKGGFQPDHSNRVAWDGIAPQLEQGALHANGFLPGVAVPQAIHPAFAAAALPDFGGNTLSLNGTVYAGVRIWRGASTTCIEPFRTDKTQLAKKAEADCAEWLTRSWPEAPGVTKPDWRDKAKVFGLKNAAFDRAWATAAWVNPMMSAKGAPKKIPR